MPGNGYRELTTKELVADEDAFDYAFERCTNGTDEEIAEFKAMLVDWFYSGNWTRVTEED